MYQDFSRGSVLLFSLRLIRNVRRDCLWLHNFSLQLLQERARFVFSSKKCFGMKPKIYFPVDEKSYRAERQALRVRKLWRGGGGVNIMA